MELQRAVLTNVVTYGSVDLDLTKHPLVVIGGLNLDSDTPDNRNGVGKSVLWGTLPTLMYESDPLALTKRSSKKSALNDKESRISYQWSHLGKTIKAAMDSKRYYIEIDGDDLEVHKSRQEVGRDWIRKMFPLTQAEFYSYAYLTNQRAHPFQRATETDRMKYIIDLFDLEIYDKLRVYFNAKVTQAQKEADRAETLAGELQVAEVELRTIKVTKEDLTEAEEKDRKFRDKLIGDKGLMSQIQALRDNRSDANQRAKIEARISDLGVKSKDPEKEIEELEALLDAIAEYRHYREAATTFVEESEALTEQLAAIRVSKKPVDARIEEIEELLEELDAQLEAAYDIKEKRAELKSSIERFDELLADKVEGDREHWEEERAGAKALIRVAKEFGSEIVGGKKACVCPTCTQEVDVASLKKASLRAQKTLQKADAAIAYFEGFERRAKLKAEIKALPKPVDVKELKTQGRKLKAEQEKLDAIAEKQAERKKLTAQLKALREPSPVAEPATELTPKKIKARGRALSSLVDLRAQLKDLPKATLSVDEIDAKLAELDVKRKKLTKISEQASKRSSEVRAEYLRRKYVLKDVKRLRTALAESEGIIGQLKLFKTMQKAYAGDIKSEAVAGVLSMIQDQMNELQALAFPEPMRFTLSVNGKGGVEAKAIRHDGRTSDIASLSGAESSCFTLLWAVTMLVFVPEHKRPSFIILDEPDSTCSPGVRTHLIQEFLPKLMGIVPHVFWITPLDTEIFGDVPTWTIVKENGVSRIEGA